MKRIITFCLAAMMLFSLVACSTGTTSTETTAAATTAAATTAAQTTAAATTAAETTAATTAVETTTVAETTAAADEKAAWVGKTLNVAIAVTEESKDNSWWETDIWNAAQAWSEETGVTLEIRSGGGIEQIMAAQAAGHGIDVMRNSPFPSLAATGIAMPVEDYLYGYEDIFNQTELDTWQGHVWRLTNAECNYISGMLYNAGLFEEAGVKTPKEYYEEDNWTWETFLEVCRAMTQDLDGDGVTDVWGCNVNNLALNLGYAIVGFNEDGSAYSKIADDDNRDIMEFVYQLCSVEKVIPDASVDLSTISCAKGTCAMEQNYSLYGKVADDGSAIIPVPMPKKDADSEYVSHYMNDYAYYIGAACEEPRIAIDLVAYLEVNAHQVYRAKRLEKKNNNDSVDLQYVLDLDKTLMAVTVNDWFTMSGVTINLPANHSGDYGIIFTTPTATAMATLAEKHQAEIDTYNAKYVYFTA